VLEGDRFVCDSLVIERGKDTPPITTEHIRTIPVQSIIAQVAFRYIYRVKNNPSADGEVLTPIRRFPDFKRLTKAGPTRESLEYVALWYRLMYACNLDPAQAVEDAFGLARSTAQRWVSKARNLGLIAIPDPRRRK
jgi:hypothetical protein